MVPSGAPVPSGGAQTVNRSVHLRPNSGLLGGQGGQIAAQSAFPSLVSPHSQYGNINLLGNLSNVSSLLGGGSNASIGANQSFSTGSVPQPSGSNPGPPGSANIHRGGIGISAEPDPFSVNGMGFNASPLTFNSSNASGAISPGISGSLMGSGGTQLPNSNNQLAQDPHHTQQFDVQNFARMQQGQDSSNSMQIQSPHMLASRGLQHFSAQNNVGLGVGQQQQLQSLRALSGDQNGPQSLTSLRGLVPVKMEPQMAVDQSAPQQLPNLQTMGPMKLDQQQQQTVGRVKLEPQLLQQQQQQLAALRSIAGIKSETENSDQSLFLQQQQQQLMQMSRQSSQKIQLQAAAQMSLLQQQQQQQQMLKTLPLQHTQLQQAMQQFQQHNLPLRSTVKSILYEPGMCARRLTQYMSQQQHRPADNNIEFWQNFVSEYFAPHAKKRWCVSLYGNGRQTTGVFPQDIWHCGICNIKPGRGFETTVEVLPRLCKIKYDSGTLEELLYVDMPCEYQTSSGHIVLDYGKAIQESVFEQLRVVRDGQLRVVFSMDLKICSWEFCARRHEELIPRRLILSQVSQLGAVAQKYQASMQNGSSNLSVQELQNNCNMFVSTARHIAKAMEVPLGNDLGYTKRYVRCLQISEVVNCMKDLIDYSRQTQNSPIASLINFPRRTTGSDKTNQGQQKQEEQTRSQNGESCMQASIQQLTQGNGVGVPTSSLNTSPMSTFTIASGITNLVHQQIMNTRITRPDNPLNNASSPFESSVQMSSAGSSSSIQQQSHADPSSPFPNTAPATSNPLPQSSIPPTAHSSSANSSANLHPPQASHSGEVEPDDSQSSVQQIIQEIMMSSQPNMGGNVVGVGALGNEMKSLNAVNVHARSLPLKATNLVGNGISNGTSVNGVGFGNMGGINPISATTLGGLRQTMSGNSLQTLNGRISMQSMSQQDPHLSHQQDIRNRMLSGIGSINNFSNLQFDWKQSP